MSFIQLRNNPIHQIGKEDTHNTFIDVLQVVDNGSSTYIARNGPTGSKQEKLGKTREGGSIQKATGQISTKVDRSKGGFGSIQGGSGLVFDSNKGVQMGFNPTPSKDKFQHFKLPKSGITLTQHEESTFCMVQSFSPNQIY